MSGASQYLAAVCARHDHEPAARSISFALLELPGLEALSDRCGAFFVRRKRYPEIRDEGHETRAHEALDEDP